MNEIPHIILETANFHGGDVDEIKQAIQTFGEIDYPDLAIKFHAFKADNVALPDFSWYPVVKNFFINEHQWNELINLAVQKKFKVWLDLFCVYGVEILEKNRENIYGIKLQPSILDNLEIVEALKPIDLTGTVLTINVSGLEISEIHQYLDKFRDFRFKDIVLQIGFQNYPTQVADTSLKKIDVLKSAFPGYTLSYADHIDAEMALSRRFPVYAWQRGCRFIEKHICNNRKETQYDFNSALEKDEIAEIAGELLQAQQCFVAPFISENEKKYFDKTLQKPILKHSLRSGQLVASTDVIYRRTDRSGLNDRELRNIQQQYHILNKPLEKHSPITAGDFKKPRIAAIVAARMKSSRLKQKAILPIGGMSSIERCLDNCLRFPHTDEVILATSTVEEDAVLGDYILDGRARFWQGHPDDVISRYLGACEKYDIDVIIRVTGDCPVISPEIASCLLESHFRTGADFTESRQFAVGSNSQVYNVEALKRVIQLVGSADYSEHMTLYMTNNPDIFKVNYIDLPPELVRDYRLTLDYQEDLDMFNALFDKLAEEELEPNLINCFKILDANPDIPKMNAHKTLIYKTDEKLIKLLNEKTTIKIK